jgi:hypothetical protein
MQGASVGMGVVDVVENGSPAKNENLQSYWTIKKLRKLTVVLDYYKAKETYSRIGLLRSYGNLQSYSTTK